MLCGLENYTAVSSLDQKSSSLSNVVASNSKSGQTAGIVIGVLAAVFILAGVIALSIIILAVVLLKKNHRFGKGNQDSSRGKEMKESNGEIEERTSKLKSSTLLEIQLDELQIKRKIAAGSFGIVYEASYHEEPVAVKKFKVNLAENEAMLADFENEVKVLG